MPLWEIRLYLLLLLLVYVAARERLVFVVVWQRGWKVFRPVTAVARPGMLLSMEVCHRIRYLLFPVPTAFGRLVGE